LILNYQYYYDQNNLDSFVDISQKRLPVILILVLVGILVLQFVTNNQNSSMLIDPETCEIYIKDTQINGKQYLNEFDSKMFRYEKS